MICDEAIFSRADMSRWSQVILFDVPSIAACTSVLPSCLTSATSLFVLPSEFLVVPLLRSNGIPLTSKSEASLPLSYMHNDASPPPSLDLVRNWWSI